MSRTITANYPSGVILTNPGDTPLSIVSGATVSNGSGTALQGTQPGYYAIANAGFLLATGTTAGSGNGLALAAGGSVTNQTGGSIGGYGFGVSIAGTGSVVNQGGITATQATGPGYTYSAANGGRFSALSAGVYLAGGGISNAQGGTIAGTFLGIGLGGAGTVVNAGTIRASATSGSAGLLLTAGGTLTNAPGGVIAGANYGILEKGGLTVDNQANATLSGSTYGIFAFKSTGSVTNTGTINGSRFAGIFLGKGGTIANLTGASIGTISGGIDGVLIQGGLGVVTNQGTIRNQTLFTTQTYVFGGVILSAGGSVTNSGSIISGSHGIRIAAAAGTVVNSGLISSARSVAGGGAVNLQAGGTVTNSGTVQSGFYGVEVAGGAGTVTNTGTILSFQTGSGGAAVNFAAGGSVANGGTITGYFYGVRVAGAAGTVTNTGTVLSTRTSAGAGVALAAGGTGTNGAGGVIAGEWIGFQAGYFPVNGVRQPPAPASTFVNQGIVLASDGANGAAVWFNAPGVIVNDTDAVIQGDTNGTIVGGPLNGVHAGGFGIVAYYQTTLINRGTIGGTNFAFDAANTNATLSVGNLIEMAPGAKFLGAVKGAVRASDAGLSTLELLSGASAGVVANFGTTTVSAGHMIGYVNIGHVTIDSGARWSLGGTVAAGTTLAFAPGGPGERTAALTLANPALMQGIIAGFGAGETLSLAGITDVTGVTLSASGNVLTVTESAGPGLTLRFDPAQTFNGTFGRAVSGGATNITLVPCFAAGTAIRTGEGPIPVEHLRPGTRALTHRGDTAEIVWIGRRAVDCRRHPDPDSVHPVRVSAGAFGPGRPSRDLRLSPDHAVFVDGVLIPVRRLVNGRTIQQEIVPDVTYYHVELSAHDVILAEDLPVESFLDTGGRRNFGNGGGPVRLFPDFGSRAWEMAGCAPLIVTGPVLDRVRAALALGEAVIPAPAGLAAPRRSPWTRLTNRYTYY